MYITKTKSAFNPKYFLSTDPSIKNIGRNHTVSPYSLCFYDLSTELLSALAALVILLMSEVGTGTTFATLASFTAHGAVATHRTLGTLWTGTTLTLNITLRLFNENTA